MGGRFGMVTLLGTLGLMGEGCGPCYAALPPPPYLPSYDETEAMRRFRESACARALGESQASAIGLHGYMWDSGPPTVLLDLEVMTPPSPLGVRYRTTTVVGLVPETGDVARPEECTQELSERMRRMTQAIAAAEASPEVRDFLARNGPVDRIVGHFDTHGPRGGRIVYVVLDPEGPGPMLTWE